MHGEDAPAGAVAGTSTQGGLCGEFAPPHGLLAVSRIRGGRGRRAPMPPPPSFLPPFARLCGVISSSRAYCTQSRRRQRSRQGYTHPEPATTPGISPGRFPELTGRRAFCRMCCDRSCPPNPFPDLHLRVLHDPRRSSPPSARPLIYQIIVRWQRPRSVRLLCRGYPAWESAAEEEKAGEMEEGGGGKDMKKRTVAAYLCGRPARRQAS